MDGLTLPLVSNAAAPALPGAAENWLLDPNTGDAGTDFASLLAAGLMSQQPMLQTTGETELADDAARNGDSLIGAAQPSPMPLSPQALPVPAAATPNATQENDALTGETPQAQSPQAAASSTLKDTSPTAGGTAASLPPNPAIAAKAVKGTDLGSAADADSIPAARSLQDAGAAAGAAADASVAADTATFAARSAGSETIAGIAPEAFKVVPRPDASRGGPRLETEAIAPDGAGATNTPTQAALHLEVAGQRPTPMPTAVLDVPVPVRSQEFPAALSQQVVWMLDKDAQVAELRLNPPELGPVEVRLTLTGDDASAQFVSPHAEVRSALEASLVRLREAMAEAGIRLGDASVSADSFRGEQSPSDASSARTGAGYDDRITTTEGVASARPGSLRRSGLVDVFA